VGRYSNITLETFCEAPPVSRETLEHLCRYGVHLKKENPVILDLGSGPDFPGPMPTILGIGEAHLVESDQRKRVFP